MCASKPKPSIRIPVVETCSFRPVINPARRFTSPTVRDFTTVPVPLVALDDYFAEGEYRVALLKIDVEGAELGVLKGAERILRQHKPLLVFECENRHLAPGNVRDVFSWLEQLGYEGRFISRPPAVADRPV